MSHITPLKRAPYNALKTGAASYAASVRLKSAIRF